MICIKKHIYNIFGNYYNYFKITESFTKLNKIQDFTGLLFFNLI
jgi:hypothetical protein